jgi:hypothetical protein
MAYLKRFKPLKRGKPPRRRSKTRKSLQMPVFKLIWDSRPHRCVVCDANIPEPAPINFSHLLPKGTYKHYIDNPENIVIKCADCHALWGVERAKNLISRPKWKEICELYYKLLTEYNEKYKGYNTFNPRSNTS